MKRLLVALFAGVCLLAGNAVEAQFRSLPAAVTDSFKLKYPNAKEVSWQDNLTSFQAKFKLDTATYIAKFKSKGEWQGSETKIKLSELPTVVSDGLSKSKYAVEWNKGSVTKLYQPDGQVQYSIQVYKSDFNRKKVVFNSEGRLIKD